MSFTSKTSRFLLSTTLFFLLITPQLCFSSAEAEEGEKEFFIALVAPSGAVNPDVVKVFRQTLEKKGCRTLLTDHYQDTTKAPYGYHSESDKVRTKFFVDALNGDAQAIGALRGGYGSQAVVRALKTAPLESRPPKILVGFSDFTLLGLYCQSTFGDHFLHAPMYYAAETQETSGATIGSGTSLTEVTDILKGDVSQLTYMLKPLNDKAKETTIEGSHLLGGNLSVIQRNAFGLLRDLSFERVNSLS
ncbi:MAG TPA: hypothetical protein DD412_02715 [Holosporales bacterium]|nr:hypothetical protein [Holosporales bacterium]